MADAFLFNRDYKDHGQVADHLPAYMAVFDELTAAGRYPYDASFEGRIPGIAGRDEKTAIYLLQGLRHLNELSAQVDAAVADGFSCLPPGNVGSEPVRYREVVEYGFYMGGTGWRTWSGARLLRCRHSVVVMPKGARTNGHTVTGHLLVKR